MKKQSHFVYALKTIKADMTSYNGFKWKQRGRVVAPDWKDTLECGNGLHAFLFGEGDGSLANWSEDAKWLILQIDTRKTKILDLKGKIKFRECLVVYCGNRETATQKIKELGGRAIIGGTSTSGDGGTSISGYGGTSISGDRGTSTSGYGGTSISGDGGTSTSGDGGTILIKWWDSTNNRYRIVIGYVGENGIEPNKKYRLNEQHKFEEVK